MESIRLKVNSKFARWNSTHLSFARRLVLLKSILSSLPLYYMFIVKTPKLILKNIDSLMWNFLWGGLKYSRKFYSISWDVVTRLKEFGRLGVY